MGLFVDLTQTSLVAASHCEICAWEYLAENVVIMIRHSCNERNRYYLARGMTHARSRKKRKKKKKKKREG